MKTDITKIISVGLSVLAALIGAIAWLTAIQINGQTNTTSIGSIQTTISGMATDLGKVKTDVALIKQAVGVKDTTTASADTTFRSK